MWFLLKPPHVLWDVFVAHPAKGWVFFLGGGSGKNAMAFFNYNLPPPKKNMSFFLKVLFFQLQSPVTERSFDLFSQMIAPLFMVSDINKQQKRRNLRELSFVNGSKTQRWRFLGCSLALFLFACSCSIHVSFFFLRGKQPRIFRVVDCDSAWCRLFLATQVAFNGICPDLVMGRATRKEDPTT